MLTRGVIGLCSEVEQRAKLEEAISVRARSGTAARTGASAS